VACLGRIAASFIVLIISYVKGKTNEFVGHSAFVTGSKIARCGRRVRIQPSAADFRG
jgi:hypothetical protein